VGTFEYVPMLHLVHAEALLEEYMPRPHGMQLKPPDSLGLVQYPELHVHQLSKALPLGEVEWSGQAMQMLGKFRPRRLTGCGEMESYLPSGQKIHVGYGPALE